MTKADISYRKGDLFTSFYPDTPQGVVAWRELAERTDWTGKVLTIQTSMIVHELEKAGFVVAEMTDDPLTQDEINQLANELSEFEA